ncbi:MAG: hypothetical protein AAFR87_16385 [Bacteroidota bacterium]
MKKVFITLVSLLVLLVTLNNLHAQDNKKKHEVHVKVKKIINGKETLVDSTFTLDGDADLDEIMKILGEDMGDLHEDVDDKVRKRVERRVIKEGKDGEKEVEVHVEVEGDDDRNVFIFKPENGDKEKVMMHIDGDIDVENEHVFIMKSADGKVIEIKQEDGEKKIIRINVDTDSDESGETKIWKSEDGKVIEIEGEDGERELDDEDIKKLLKEKGIDWEEMKAEGATIKKSSNINVGIKPINEEDKKALKEIGLEEKEYAGDLRISEMMIKVENEGPVMLQVDTEESGHLIAVVRDIEGEVISKTVLKESSNAYKIYQS